METLQVVGGFFFFFRRLNMGLVDSCSFFLRFFFFCKQELFIIVFPLVSMNGIPSSSIVKLHQVLFLSFSVCRIGSSYFLLLQVAITPCLCPCSTIYDYDLKRFFFLSAAAVFFFLFTFCLFSPFLFDPSIHPCYISSSTCCRRFLFFCSPSIPCSTLVSAIINSSDHLLPTNEVHSQTLTRGWFLVCFF